MRLEREIDSRILTAFEHELIGSSPPDSRMYDQPNIPEAIIEGSMTPQQVGEARDQAQTFVSWEASGYFGIRRKDAAVISLSGIDPETHQVTNVPFLKGVLYRNGVVKTDPKTLRRHSFRVEQVEAALNNSRGRFQAKHRF